MLNARYFNNVTIIDDSTLKKSSTDIQKIISEYKWYEDNEVFNCPKVSNLIVKNGSASYLIEYVHGRTLADLYINETLPPEIFNNIIQIILNKVEECRDLDNTGGLRYKDQITSVYKNKTIERLSAAGIDLYSEYIINGERCPRLIDIIDDCAVPVMNSDICKIHGDLCFSNIILSDKYDITTGGSDLAEYLYFIDPRGRLTDGTITSYGDYKYDIGKLAHSLIGGYDIIKADKIVADRISETEFRIDVCEPSYYSQRICNIMFSKYEDEQTIYNIMVHLFLSMIPLHTDKPDQQIAMFANALRIYQERKHST